MITNAPVWWIEGLLLAMRAVVRLLIAYMLMADTFGWR